MRPDELLDDLGRSARTQDARAAAAEVDAAELLRPLDAAARDRIAARLVPLLQAEREATRASPGTMPSPTALRRSQSRSRSRRWMIAAVPLLVAASVLLWLRWPHPDAALPAYALELQGGQVAVRGAADSTVLRVGADDRVTAVLRPATTVSGPVAVWIFVDGKALPDAPTRVERSSAGALRISGLGPPLGALLPGRHWLQFAVGRPGNLSAPVTRAPLQASGGIQVLSYEVERASP